MKGRDARRCSFSKVADRLEFPLTLALSPVGECVDMVSRSTGGEGTE